MVAVAKLPGRERSMDSPMRKSERACASESCDTHTRTNRKGRWFVSKHRRLPGRYHFAGNTGILNCLLDRFGLLGSAPVRLVDRGSWCWDMGA